MGKSLKAVHGRARLHGHGGPVEGMTSDNR